ncbi:hypothetical protein A3I51_01150 [Candidatus Gottesmanbacteria bacterium RIFCSPLOWO2_02_FULL_38_8]|uniref:Methyltransferase domain-containing protein n=1 Tax=Candidatus Gottesmanbacteria bacterium RIFCSPLOWO2_02_FULL_38_8 TaxID=1798397 RepID=A0A1F6B5H7_9BACT|nr:MAG: hypothetical protein A3I51_01150 [Candidatus Gottesmanbacteria bacterium RIFCSPLOWO2_02_FULL_38_8]
MKNKYWAKTKYSTIDPFDYEIQRFSSPAGKLIDELEKKTVLELFNKHNLGNITKSYLSILDVATGTGRLAYFIENYVKNASIIGMDINENMLKRSNQIKSKNKSRIKFIKGDLYHLPFKVDHFDTIVGLRFSMHLPKFEEILKEFSRVLNKDGLLIFDIFNHNSILRLRLLRNINKADKGYFSLNDMIKIAKENYFHFIDYQGILLFGETPLRLTPKKLLFLHSPITQPPRILQQYSSKLILCFRKV